MFNMFPIYAFDGDKLFEEVIRNTISKEKKIKIGKKSFSKRSLFVNSARIIAIFMLVANFVLPLLTVGFTPF